MPLYELKRRAAAGEKFAHAIYPAVAYPSLRGLLGLLLAFFSALGLILLNRHIALVYGLIVASIWLWLVYSWIPNRPVAKVSRYFARLAAPFFIWLFSWSHPAFKHLERLQKHYEPTHTQLYEIEDLLADFSCKFITYHSHSGNSSSVISGLVSVWGSALLSFS